MKGSYHPLGDGDGADAEHGLKISHPGGHSGGNDQRGSLRGGFSFHGK